MHKQEGPEPQKELNFLVLMPICLFQQGIKSPGSFLWVRGWNILLYWEVWDNVLQVLGQNERK